MTSSQLPTIIQGGMGVGVSGWNLARSVSMCGQLGVVSGTALDAVLVRRLQEGDPGGHMQRALAAFPFPGVSERIVGKYYREGGTPEGKPYIAKPLVGQTRSQLLDELLVVANFAEVWLAKEGHDHRVGINFLHKIQAPLLPSIFGAMLAGVDIVLVGAGIPLDIPGILDGLAAGSPVEMRLDVKGASAGATHSSTFDPRMITGRDGYHIPRPLFFPIVASNTLATLMVSKCGNGVNGLVVEGATAGGHNAPPRGPKKLSDRGEPVYGPRDSVDPAALMALGVPFWMAGSYGSPARLAEALEAGATGIQVGTLFALSDESGLRPDLKERIIAQSLQNELSVYTDAVASPTGFPFKVVTSVEDTIADPDQYANRARICDLGYLREAFETEDGVLDWRCPADEVKRYVAAGGQAEQTDGRLCLCNGLMATIGLGQVRKDGSAELPLLTGGDDVSGVPHLVADGATSYPSTRVISWLLTAS